MTHLKITYINRFKVLTVFVLLTSCSQNKQLFSLKGPEKGIYLEMLNETVPGSRKESCLCNSYFEQTVRVFKKIDEHTMRSRDYYNQNFYALGEVINGRKVGVWKIYCEDVKVLEEFWIEGNLVWIKKFDSEGGIIETIHLGIEAENF